MPLLRHKLPPLILFVENDAKDSDLCIALLASYESWGVYRTAFVRHGPAALDYLRAASGKDDVPRAVVLDLNLPSMHGLEVLRAIRADPVFAQIPVVVLSSSLARTEIDECYSAGANAYVTKPVGFLDFESAVRAIAAFWTTINVPPGLAAK